MVTLDWAIAETLIALGMPPLGAAEIPSYNRTVVEPAMPTGVADVGLRLAPNPEVMRLLKPDLILINPDQAYLRPSLAPFGTIQIVPIYQPGGQPYDQVWNAAHALSDQFGTASAWEALRKHAADVLETARQALAGYDGRPLTIVSFVDDRHVSVFGGHSLFDGVLDALGLKNAWAAASGPWGASLLGLERLVTTPETRLLYFGPLPPETRRTFAQDSLWNNLPFVRDHRVIELPAHWAYGGVPSALRFAHMLGAALGVERRRG